MIAEFASETDKYYRFYASAKKNCQEHDISYKSAQTGFTFLNEYS